MPKAGETTKILPPRSASSGYKSDARFESWWLGRTLRDFREIYRLSLVVRVRHRPCRRRHRSRARRNTLAEQGRPHMETLVPRSLRFAALVRAPHAIRTRCHNQIRYAIVNGSSCCLSCGQCNTYASSGFWQPTWGYSQFDHGQRHQGMPGEPSGGKFDKTPMETRAGPGGEQRFDERTRDAESSQSVRHIDPVGAPKPFDKARMGSRARDLVMICDHRLDFWDPIRSRAGRKVLVRQRNRRRDVVPCMVGPDPKVVKGGSDRHHFELVVAVGCDRQAQVHDAVHVVPVPDEVASK